MCLYTPEHDTVFGESGLEMTASHVLTDEELVALHNKYM